jgi:hypothetical protein
MKKLFILLTIGFAAGLISCNSDETTTGVVNLKSEVAGSTSINTGGRLAAAIEITEFMISIRDVSFKNEDDANPEFDTLDVKFRGPYLLDLLNAGDAVTETIGAQEIPNGNYKEIRFKLHKDEDLASSSDLYDRSIFLAGTIDGTPFEMWHDTSENMDVGRTTGVVVMDNEVSLSVVFNVDQFLNSVHNIDLTQAVDGNNDGLIEINPNDVDGNKDIADELKDNIKAAADLMDF